MKIVCKMIEHIKDELDDAAEYAEKYLENKKSAPETASMYKTMSSDELKHATMLKDIYTAKFEDMRKSFAIPVDDEDAWVHCHKRYAEREAQIKHMLTL